MVRDNPEVNKRVADMTALGRVGQPDDIVPMIASLLSEDNRWVNALRIEVSGGMSSSREEGREEQTMSNTINKQHHEEKEPMTQTAQKHKAPGREAGEQQAAAPMTEAQIDHALK